MVKFKLNPNQDRTLKKKFRIAIWIRIICVLLVPAVFYLSSVLVTEGNYRSTDDGNNGT